MKGALYIIPSLLGSDDADRLLPAATLEKIRSLRYFIVEKEKSARRFLKSAASSNMQSDYIIFEIDKHGENDAKEFLAPALEGNDMGLLSEAGAPAVADPGSVFIYAAHKMGIRVIPLTGPSSLLLALMSSGLNGQSFCFHGYLPSQSDERVKKIKAIEKNARSLNQTQLFIETPYRNNALLKDLLHHLFPDTRLCIAAGLTLPDEYILTQTVEKWKKKVPELNKKPCVFLLH